MSQIITHEFTLNTSTRPVMYLESCTSVLHRSNGMFFVHQLSMSIVIVWHRSCQRYHYPPRLRSFNILHGSVHVHTSLSVLPFSASPYIYNINSILYKISCIQLYTLLLWYQFLRMKQLTKKQYRSALSSTL